MVTRPARLDHPRARTVNTVARSRPNNLLSRETADDLRGTITIWDGFNRKSDFNEFDKAQTDRPALFISYSYSVAQPSPGDTRRTSITTSAPFWPPIKQATEFHGLLSMNCYTSAADEVPMVCRKKTRTTPMNPPRTAI